MGGGPGFGNKAYQWQGCDWRCPSVEDTICHMLYVTFDPRLTHFVMPSKGRRVVITAFTIRNLEKLSPSP